MKTIKQLTELIAETDSQINALEEQKSQKIQHKQHLIMQVTEIIAQSKPEDVDNIDSASLPPHLTGLNVQKEAKLVLAGNVLKNKEKELTLAADAKAEAERALVEANKANDLANKQKEEEEST